jgi:hypothetical protein
MVLPDWQAVERKTDRMMSVAKDFFFHVPFADD